MRSTQKDAARIELTGPLYVYRYTGNVDVLPGWAMDLRGAAGWAMSGIERFGLSTVAPLPYGFDADEATVLADVAQKYPRAVVVRVQDMR